MEFFNIMKPCKLVANSPSNYKDVSDELIAMFDKENRGAVVFGAQNMGAVIFDALNYYKIRVVCFCDNSPPESNSCYGLPCLTPEEAVNKYPDALFVFSALEPKTCYKMKEQLLELNSNILCCFWDIVYYAYVISCRNVDNDNFSKALYCFWGENQNNKLTINSLSLRITSRCNLRCNECLFLVPLQPKLFDYHLNELVASLKTFCTLVDGILDLTINGGETFLYSELPKLITEIAQIPNIINIVIATNGTVIPSDEVLKLCANNAIRIRTSNYGGALDKTAKLHEKCRIFGVSVYNYRFVEKWCNFGTIKHNRTDEENQHIADNCPYNGGKNYRGMGIYQNKVHLCDRYDGLSACGLIDDTIDQKLGFDLDINDKNAFRNFLSGDSLYKQCDMCNWPMGEIPPGEQLETNYKNREC
jgi:hypothetical protein